MIEKDILEYSKSGKIILAGDLNARISENFDYIANDCDKHVPLYYSYKLDNPLVVRKSKDKILCSRGRQLLSLCISSGLRILNGRTFGDLNGALTCHQPLGSSIVDYILVSENLLNDITYFRVHKYNPVFSDHCQMSCMLQCNYMTQSKYVDNTSKLMPDKYIWNTDSPEKYQEALNSPEIRLMISNLQNSKTDDIDKLIGDLDSIFITAADMSLKIKKNKIGNAKIKKKANKDKPWFNSNLKILKRELDLQCKKFQENYNNPYIRGNFFKCLKIYRKTRKEEMRTYRKDLINKLDTLYSNNPKEYWELVEKLKNDKDNFQKESSIDMSEWKNHFENLNKRPNKNNYLDLLEKLNKIEKEAVFNELDYKIKTEEVFACIKTMKNGKACGFNKVSNEMIKHGQHVLGSILTKIFNEILLQGIYPQSWALNYITPLHKKGPVDEPSNYRGITISNNISKLFNKILDKRLTTFFNKHEIICREQIGFRANNRTVDHMFILKTLINKYVKNKSKPLYTCFVDFKHAFDSVPHEGLFYKLKLAGVGTKFYNVIKSMYKNINICVKIGKKHTDFFPSSIGVRQGDNLSPNLFNLYLSDLPSYFDSSCEPVMLNNVKVNCLLYADDLVLLSTSKSGLQNSIDKLSQFAREWHLEINTNKTKVLTFNKSGRITKSIFKFDNTEIENVQKYTYLGVTFAASGTFSYAKHEINNKGLKALYKIKKAFSTFHPKTCSLVHIFHHTVKPVLLYGAEIWGEFSAKKFDEDPENFMIKEIQNLITEKVHLKFCQFVLRVGPKTSHIGMRGELGSLPLLYFVYLSMIKYWLRLCEIKHGANYFLKNKNTRNLSDNKDNSHRLLEAAFQESIVMSVEEKESWFNCIQKILKLLKLDYILKDSSKYTKNYIINKVKYSLKSKFIELWNKQLKNDNKKHAKVGNKLRTYRTFKNIYQQEPYLNIGTQEQRKFFAKFRLSDHNLNIEKGRYFNLNIEDRKCSLCNTSVEDEKHFLLECKNLENVRKQFLDSINNECKNFSTLSSDNKFLWLMSNEDVIVLKVLMKMVFELFQYRSILQNQTSDTNS